MTLWTLIGASILVAGLTACGGGSSSPSPTENPDLSGPTTEPEESENTAPTARIEAPDSAEPGTAITLDGSGSTDPEGDQIDYRWVIEGDSAARFLDIDGQLAESLINSQGRLFIPASEAGTTLSIRLETSDREQLTAETRTIDVAPCPAEPGQIFVECVHSDWFGISAWEQDIATETFHDQHSGSDDHHVLWSVEEPADSERGKVLDVAFTRADTNGFLRFNSAGFPEGTTDMTAFADGQLVFDIRRLDVASSELFLKLECDYPCESMALPVATAPEGEWRTVSVPVSDLTDSGLELENVDIGFQLYPTWDEQEGAHFQLDNVRWESASCEASDNVVYDECVGLRWGGIGAWDSTYANPYWQGDTDNHIRWERLYSGDPERNYVLSIGFHHPDADGDLFIYSPNSPEETEDMSAYLNGALVLDLKVTDYGETQGELYINIHCIHPCQSGPLSLGRPEIGEWTTHAVPVADMVAGGLDITSVSTGLVILPDREDQQGVQFQVDQVRWEAQAP